MIVDNLNYFVTVIEQKSITKAAKLGHISQSGLTQIIKKIEDDLGCDLLLRSNKGIEPTECGLLVYEYAKKMIDLDDSMKQRLTCMLDGCFSIVVKPCCSLDNSLIPSILFNMQNKYANIKMNVEQEDKDKIFSEVKSGVTDFGILMGEITESDEIDSITVGMETIVLVAGNQLIKENMITIEDLPNYKIIDFSLGSYAKEVHAILSKHVFGHKDKKTYVPFFSIDSIPAIKSLIENNFGISFLPLYSIQEELRAGKFKVVELDDFHLSLPIRILSKKDDHLFPDLQNIKKYFVNSALKYFKEFKVANSEYYNANK